MPRNNQNVELQDTAAANSAALADSVQSMFRPIARMLARRGVGARTTTEIAKRAYVAATVDVLRERGLPVTTARLSVFTGLTHSEVDRIQSIEAGPPQSQHETNTVLPALLSAWHEDPRYAIPFTGAPFELDFDGPSNRPTFTELVREVAPAHSPKELLAVLVRSGAARINDENGRIQAVSRALIAEPYSLEAVSRLEQMVRNLAETSYFNFQTADATQRRFNRNTIADFALHPEAEEKFRAVVQVEGQRFLEALDKWLKDQDRAPQSPKRVGVAVFHFVESGSS